MAMESWTPLPPTLTHRRLPYPRSCRRMIGCVCGAAFQAATPAIEPACSCCRLQKDMSAQETMMKTLRMLPIAALYCAWIHAATIEQVAAGVKLVEPFGVAFDG